MMNFLYSLIGIIVCTELIATQVPFVAGHITHLHFGVHVTLLQEEANT